MLKGLPGESRKTVGADKAYDIEPFIEGSREINVTPHVAQNTTNRCSRNDERTTRHAGYRLSQVARRLIESVFCDAERHGILDRRRCEAWQNATALHARTTVVNLRRLRRLLAMCPSG
jgi:hypothetical protein